MMCFQGQAPEVRCSSSPRLHRAAPKMPFNSGLKSRCHLNTYLSVIKSLDFAQIWMELSLNGKNVVIISSKFIWEDCPVLAYVHIFHCGHISWTQQFLQPGSTSLQKLVTIKTIYLSPSLFHKPVNSQGYFFSCFLF